MNTMAEVLVAHRFTRMGKCACGVMVFDPTPENLAGHVADALTKAGYGKLADAWDEGWAHYRKWFTPVDPEFGINPYRSAS